MMVMRRDLLSMIGVSSLAGAAGALMSRSGRVRAEAGVPAGGDPLANATRRGENRSYIPVRTLKIGRAHV